MLNRSTAQSVAPEDAFILQINAQITETHSQLGHLASTQQKIRSGSMLSERVGKVDTMPSKVLFGVAAGLVFVCQLAALALVANGQVEKAHVRDAYYSSAQKEMAECSKTYSGPARSQCIERINATINPYSTYTSSLEAQAHSSVIQLVDQGVSVMPSATPAVQGFMSTAFASR